MNIGIPFYATALSLVVYYLIYLALTNTSEFKKQPEEKQSAGKKRLKIMFSFVAAVTIYQFLIGSFNVQ